MGSLSKFVKKVKKQIKRSVKDVGKVADFIAPGTGSASKKAIKKVLPIYGAASSVIGSPAIQGIAGQLNIPGFGEGGFVDDLQNFLRQAQEVAGQFAEEETSAAEPLAEPAPAPQGLSPMLVLGGLGLVVVVLALKKG